MEELRPEELEELVQELEGESSAQETPPLDIDEVLRVLQSGALYVTRRDAAEQLGRVGTSSPRIVQSLIEAEKSDSNLGVRQAAMESLRAPVHQTILRQHPELEERARSAAQRRMDAEPVTRPAYFQVENQGDTVFISWKPDMGERRDASKIPLWVLLLSAIFLWMVGSMSPGGSRAVWLGVLSAVAVGAAYWIAAIWVNGTKISTGQEAWLFERGPLPIPNRQFYFRSRRLEPAACSWVWIDREERYKLKISGSSASGGSTEGALGCLLALIELGIFLSSIRRELVVTYKLNARSVDGGDKELLTLSSKREAEYLEQTLQGQIEAGGGQPAQG